MSGKRSKALDALLGGATVEQAAGLVGVTDRTVYRWLRLPKFRSELRKAQSSALERVSLRLVAAAGDAVDALLDVQSRPEKRGQNVKRLAAMGVLDLCYKWQEPLDFDARLTALEERLQDG